MAKLWRPNEWWNPFDYMTVDTPEGIIGIDVFIEEDGEKMSAKDRDRYFKTFEAGADAMLEALRQRRKQ